MTKRHKHYDLKQCHALLKMYEEQILTPKKDYAHVLYAGSPLQERVVKTLGPLVDDNPEAIRVKLLELIFENKMPDIVAMLFDKATSWKIVERQTEGE